MTTLGKGEMADSAWLTKYEANKQQGVSAHLYDELDLSGPKIKDVMLRNFGSIDTNKDDRLSQKEMDSYKPAPEDALVHRYVQHRVSDIGKLQRESFFSGSKISRDDLRQLAIKESTDLRAVKERFNDYATVFEANFKRLDTDSNRIVSREELDKAELDPKYDVGAKQMIRFFRENYDPIESGLKGAFMPDGSGIDNNIVKLTGEIFDFDSTWSNSYTRVSLPIGGLLGGGAGGALLLWRFRGLASQVGIKATSTNLAIAAGIGAVAAGGYMFATALQQEKTIPKARLALYDSLNRELSEGTASPMAGSLELAAKYQERMGRNQIDKQNQKTEPNQRGGQWEQPGDPAPKVEIPDFGPPKSKPTGMPNSSTRKLFRELEK